MIILFDEINRPHQPPYQQSKQKQNNSTKIVPGEINSLLIRIPVKYGVNIQCMS
jgi:hypothetical protein